MSIKVIQARLKTYNCQSQQEEENAIKEILQEIILMALTRSDFFTKAALQGGTALRIFYELGRFSEDLDFALLKSDKSFQISKYLTHVRQECEVYGCKLELQDRSSFDNNVRKAFLKDDSLGKLLELSFAKMLAKGQKINIKLEVDVHPPDGANFENKFHNFPLPFGATLYELSSLFAGKSHALLCRSYDKGRDWYDFLWYAQQKTKLNYKFLQSALIQSGDLGQGVEIDKAWYLNAMQQRIKQIDWPKIVKDVSPFLKPSDRESLKFWGQDLFLDTLNRISKVI